jgi:cytochrome c oxidase subunit III
MPSGTLPKTELPESSPTNTKTCLSGPSGGPPGPSSDDGGFGDWNPMGWRTPAAASRAGIYAALASVSMLFASLTVFFMERRAFGGSWQHTPLPPVLYINTAVLLASSATFERARRALAAGRLAAFRAWLYGTLALGFAFLGGQVIAWRDLAAAGVIMRANASGALFYIVTAAHALHLGGGLVALVYLALTAPAIKWGLRRRTVVDVTRIYWHFMDGLWVYLFAVLLALHG